MKLNKRQISNSLEAGKFESVDLGCETSDSTISFHDEGDWVNDLTGHSDDDVIRGRDPKQEKITCCHMILRVFMMMSVVVAMSLLIVFSMAPKEIADYSNEEYTIRINAGASQPYYDAENNYWLPDFELGNQDDFVVSAAENSTSQAINMCPLSVSNNATEGRGLYCTQRSFSDEGRYEIAVPKNFAAYQVDLYFAELDFSREKLRMFDLFVEDFLAVVDYEIFSEAGGQYMATRLTYIIDVDDGYLSIVFKSKVGAVKISGIAVSYSDTLGDR